MVCVLHAFVYNVVDVNKIVVISSTKPHSYQRTNTFGYLPIHGVHVKPNLNTVDHYKLKFMVENVSTCNFCFMYSHCTN